MAERKHNRGQEVGHSPRLITDTCRSVIADCKPVFMAAMTINLSRGDRGGL